MNLKNRNSLAIFSLFILVIFLILFLIRPTFLEIKNISKEIKGEKEEIAILEEKTKNIENFREFYQEKEENFKKLDNIFVNQEVPVDFINFLEKVSQVARISLKISPTTPTKDPWPSLGFQLNSVGSFPDFLKFLAKLESAPYLIEIQDLTINKLTETELQSEEFKKLSPGSVKANLSIKVYTK